MAKYKVIHEKGLCIGCGACASVDEEHWKIEEENGQYKAHLKDSKEEGGEFIFETDDEEEIKKFLEVAEICPVSCIVVKEE